MVRISPDKIESLPENHVFVFGSNTSGIHGSGAALQARMQWGAKLGVGEGLTGYHNCCYAFPTLNADSHGGLKLEKRTFAELLTSVDKFFECANANPDKVFLLTKVGCGLAGYREDYMRMLFAKAPPNVVKPEGW